LLKKDVFHWSTKSQQAFDSLKTILTHAPVLTLLNFVKPFIPVTLLNDDKGRTNARLKEMVLGCQRY